MKVLDVLMPLSLVVLVIVFILLYIAQKRKERNEPVFGWKRRQFLDEQKGNNIPGEQSKTTQKKKNNKVNKSFESIVELMELKKIENRIIERERNEYLVILSSDFVNFSLLQPKERTTILEGYQQLFNMINFPVQLLAQAVRQDFSKDRIRFEKNLSRANDNAIKYNRDVLNHIQQTTENDFRITLKIFYVIKYIYEPSKAAKLTKEQREKNIIDNILIRAEIVRRALGKARIHAEVQSSLDAAESIKRALNRDRMIINPMDRVEDDEKLAPFITMDFSTIPDFDKFVTDVEEAIELVGSPYKESAYGVEEGGVVVGGAKGKVQEKDFETVES